MNPLQIDWNLLQQLPKETYIVVDNTFLSPFIFNPFKFGAHIVIDSCSKFISNTKCISGCINFKYSKDDITANVMNHLRTIGIHVSDEYCKIIYEELDTCNARIVNAFDRTKKMLEELPKNTKIDVINHPMLQLTKESYQTLFPRACYPMISICVKLDKIKSNYIYKIRNELQKLTKQYDIPFITSFGHSQDTLDSYPYFNDDSYEKIWLRIAVGYKGSEKFMENFTKLLEAL